MSTGSASSSARGSLSGNRRSWLVGSGQSPRKKPSSEERRLRASRTSNAMLRMGWPEFSTEKITPWRAASRASSATPRASMGISSASSQGWSKGLGSTTRRWGVPLPTSFAPSSAAWNCSPVGSGLAVRQGQAIARSKERSGKESTRCCKRGNTGLQESPWPVSHSPRHVCLSSMWRDPRVRASDTRVIRSCSSRCCRQELVIAPNIMTIVLFEDAF